MNCVSFSTTFIILKRHRAFCLFYYGLYHMTSPYLVLLTMDAQKSLFHWNPKQFGQMYFWGFGVSLADLSAPIFVQWVHCPCFPLISHYFYKKLSLYIQIQNIYPVLGFEFGPQRIRDLAIVLSISSCQPNLMKTYHNEANTSGITKFALKIFLEFFEQSS